MVPSWGHIWKLNLTTDAPELIIQIRPQLYGTGTKSDLKWRMALHPVERRCRRRASKAWHVEALFALRLRFPTGYQRIRVTPL